MALGEPGAVATLPADRLKGGVDVVEGFHGSNDHDLRQSQPSSAKQLRETRLNLKVSIRPE